jgi:hypothetical protein
MTPALVVAVGDGRSELNDMTAQASECVGEARWSRVISKRRQLDFYK